MAGEGSGRPEVGAPSVNRGMTLRSDTTGAPIGSSFREHASGMTVQREA